jgi:hypothetical protein
MVVICYHYYYNSTTVHTYTGHPTIPPPTSTPIGSRCHRPWSITPHPKEFILA